MPRTRSQDNKGLPENIVKKKEHYYIRLRMDGKDTWKSAGTSLNVAKIMLGKMLKAREEGRVGIKPQMRKLTLAAWSPDFMKWAKVNRRSWERDKVMLCHLMKTFGNIIMADLNVGDIETYKARRLDKGAAPGTINRELSLYRRVINKAVEYEKLEKNPINGWDKHFLEEPPPRRPVLTREEENKILALCPKDWFHLMIRVALATGCRQGELIPLQGKDIDFDQGALMIDKSGSRWKGQDVVGLRKGRGSKAKLVPIPKRLLEELQPFRDRPNDHVFEVPRTGRPPSRHTIRHRFKRLVKKIGRPDFRWHDIGHVTGTRLFRRGANVKDVAEFLGKSPRMVANTYGHASWDRLVELAETVQDEAVEEE